MAAQGSLRGHYAFKMATQGRLPNHCALKTAATGRLRGLHALAWLQGAFEATVHSNWPARVPGQPLCARPACPPGVPSRPLSTLFLCSERGACVFAARRSEKLFKASMLGLTEACFIALCCTLHRAGMCTGSH